MVKGYEVWSIPPNETKKIMTVVEFDKHSSKCPRFLCGVKESKELFRVELEYAGRRERTT